MQRSSLQAKTLTFANGENATLPFSDAEYEQRLAGLRTIMANRGLAAVLLTSMHNIAYYSGFLYCSFGRRYACVVTRDDCITLSANIDGGQPGRRSFGDNLIYTDWHQDNYYFGTTSDQVLSCGIYLQDADLDNGCLQVVPGSHRTGTIAEHQHTPSMHGSWTQIETSQAIALPMPAGSVALFSANLLHGTADNEGQRTRYSTAWHYVPADLDLERFPRGGYADRHIAREESE